MDDYKELIENVRICASGDCCGCTLHGNKINCQEVLLESAADAIEQLVKERDEWMEYAKQERKRSIERYHELAVELDRVKKDRDNIIGVTNKLGKRCGACDICGADCQSSHNRDYLPGDCEYWKLEIERSETDVR